MLPVTILQETLAEVARELAAYAEELKTRTPEEIDWIWSTYALDAMGAVYDKLQGDYPDD